MNNLKEIGWKEWLVLPGLGIPAIKAKVDTGARTSSLHSFHLETFKSGNTDMVRFHIHPLRNRTDIEFICDAPILDKRMVRDSAGHTEERFVIKSNILLGEKEWPIEITLTSRDDMLFRMLLGRTALLSGGFCVNPAKAYLLGRSKKSVYRNKK
jgi:hypothetical protein